MVGEPIWKKLGYSSEAAYLKAMSNTSSNSSITLPTLQNYAGLSNSSTTLPTAVSSVSTKLPSSVSVNTPSLLDSSIVGTGNSFSNGSSSGNTNEGVVSNTGSLVQLPQIVSGSSSGSSSSSSNTSNTSSSLANYSTEALQQSVEALKEATAANATTAAAQTSSGSSSSTSSSSSTGDTESEGRTDEGSYNGTSDFLEAFKENYGYDYDGSALVRREGMSDGTWNALQLLYKYYQQGLEDEAKKQSEIDSKNEYYQELEDYLTSLYDSSRSSLDENKAKSQQNASISLDKLLKYLPAQAKAQGYYGLGTSESSALQAYANYNNSMGNISSDYNSQMTSLDESEISEKNSLAQSKESALTDINDKYDAYERARNEAAGTEAQEAWDAYEAEVKAEEEQLKQEASAKETATYEEYRDMLNYSTSTDYDALAKSIDELDISDEYKQLLKDKAQIVVESNLKAQAEEEESKKAAEAEALYNSVADAVAVKIESAMGDDGKISQSDYDSIVAYINGYKGTLTDTQISQLMTSLEANQSYIRSEAEQSEADAQSDYYTVKTAGVTFNNNGGWWIFGQTDFSEGDNFSVIDEDGFKYRIESGGEVADSDVLSAAVSVGENQVFGYGGQIYFKQNGKVYLIQKRAHSYADHYDKLYAKFYS